MKLAESQKENSIAKMVSLYFIILPIYSIIKLEIGLKSHFIVPVLYLILMIINRKRIDFRYTGVILIFFIIQIPYSIWGYREYLYNWFGLMYLLFFCSLPWFTIGFSIKDLSTVFLEVNKKLLIILGTNILLIIYCYIRGRSMLGNMEISYSILPLAIFSFYYFFENKSIKFLFYAIFSSLMIVIIGSRGALLCIVMFFILYAITNFKKNLVVTTLIIVLGISFLFNYDKIINQAIYILDYYNIGSRTLAKFANGDITNDTGRSRLHEVAIENLDKKPLIGLGLGVERIVINKEVNNMEKDMSSSYSHNLIIEILAQYGYIIGGIVILCLGYLIIRAFIKGKKIERDFIIVLFSMEIIRLFLSSSYLLSPLFFLLLGGCFNIIDKEKVKGEK